MSGKRKMRGKERYAVFVVLSVASVAVCQTTNAESSATTNSNLPHRDVVDSTQESSVTQSSDAGTDSTTQIDRNFTACVNHVPEGDFRLCVFKKSVSRDGCNASETLPGGHVTCQLQGELNFTVGCTRMPPNCDAIKRGPRTASGQKCVDEICDALHHQRENYTVCTFRCQTEESLFARLLPLWIVLVIACAVLLTALFLCLYCCCRKKSGDAESGGKHEVEASLGIDNPTLECTQISELSTPPTGDVKADEDGRKAELSGEDVKALETGIVPFDGDDYQFNLEAEETRM